MKFLSRVTVILWLLFFWLNSYYEGFGLLVNELASEVLVSLLFSSFHFNALAVSGYGEYVHLGLLPS